MFDRRRALTEVFLDTQNYYLENAELHAAVKHSIDNTVLYREGDALSLPTTQKEGEVVVTKHKTFEAAMLYKREHPQDRVAVLNFASAVNPGGGVKRGSSAQEESLCRCSILYPTLNQKFLWDAYYSKNRAAKNVLHTDDCIWSPDVVICKTDEHIPQRMESKDWVTVDVISCAAPNLRQEPGNAYNPEGGAAVHVSDQELTELHLRRAKQILSVAASHEVDCLILGAFGCGAFMNNPRTVASAYREALKMYRGYFKRIEFAVYCRRYETENYDAFRASLAVYC